MDLNNSIGLEVISNSKILRFKILGEFVKHTLMHCFLGHAECP